MVQRTLAGLFRTELNMEREPKKSLDAVGEAYGTMGWSFPKYGVYDIQQYALIGNEKLGNPLMVG